MGSFEIAPKVFSLVIRFITDIGTHRIIIGLKLYQHWEKLVMQSFLVHGNL